MTYRVKDTAPQAVKDIENELETIEVVGRNGRQVAVAYWREHKFEEELPRGIETWPPDEAQSILRLTARRLKVKVGKAKWQAMADTADFIKDQPKEMTPADTRRMVTAAEKRELRAAKLRQSSLKRI